MSEPDQGSVGAAAPARRRAARSALIPLAAALALAIAVTLAGCSSLDAALSRQWALVEFKSNTTVNTLLRVRTACSHVPHVHAEALPRVNSTQRVVYAVRFQTSGASNADLVALQQCLQKFPAVAGIEFEDSGDS